jgi:hypothetical protein
MMVPRPPFLGIGDGQLPQDIVLHEREDILEMLILVVMRVHVDDQHIVEFALLSLLRGVGEQAAGIELLNRDAAAAIRFQIHIFAALLVTAAARNTAVAHPRCRIAEIKYGRTERTGSLI